MKCIAIDNDAKALKQICSFIEKDASLQLLARFENTQEANSFILANGKEIDAAFVSADVPGLSWGDFTQSPADKMAVIAVASDTSKAYEAYKAGCIDYILKPVSSSDFKAAVDKATKQQRLQSAGKLECPSNSPNNRFIFIKSEYKVIRVNLDQIKFVESMREYVRFHIENSRPIMSLLTIKAVENYLPKDRFMRIHRSYIINLDKINVIERARIVFDVDTFIPISEQYKDKFQSYLDKYFAQ